LSETLVVNEDYGKTEHFGRSWRNVEFRDKKGRLIRLVNHTYSFSQKKDGRRRIIETDIRYWNKHFLVNKEDSEDTTKAVFTKTGIPRENHYDLTVYDLSGRAIFRRKDVPYRLEDVSENGKYVSCLRDYNEDNILEGEDTPPHHNPPEPDVFVFSSGGKIIYHAHDEYIVLPFLSPSGNYLIYGCDRNDLGAKIIDLATRKVYHAPTGRPDHRYSGITDDGLVFSRRPTSIREPDGSSGLGDPVTTELFHITH
jgi:hypothetical protein